MEKYNRFIAILRGLETSKRELEALVMDLLSPAPSPEAIQPMEKPQDPMFFTSPLSADLSSQFSKEEIERLASCRSIAIQREQKANRELTGIDIEFYRKLTNN